MAQQTDFSPALLDYVRTVSLRDDEILSDLRRETAELPMGLAMQVMAEEAQFLALLVGLSGARTVVEIGTFTGYSTLCMARALPTDGRLITVDISARWPMIAEPYWKRAGVAERIESRVGPAADVLTTLLTDLGPDGADLVFIDADKAGYPLYYEKALRLVRPGGLVVLDNTVFFGRVLDESAHDADTAAVRELNAALLHDDRVDLAMLSMADGLTLARKR
ncbi:O-methyltransferase [Streptomyces lancefieldiae]|uniref:Class I SAM-dependent methyltransferase n=1 Tax=Streptomyces lancefieldiae TaxID=3075520 RepID=A0ABU3AQ04_9ACTN|nr:class I SAM-dependent methyltransferase [Streptomyces sp. DSM 40712]MDT0612246.1 class I SAM-dependent methyltransferase [Streptomyces sp. DSM 40712]